MTYRKVVLLALPVLLLASWTAEAQLKKRIAVARFEDRSGSGYHSLGEGVTDMLTTALVKTKQFIVLERQEMEKVMQEQQFSNSGLVTPETATKLGKVLGVELMVIGSISEFGSKESTIGGGISVFGGGVTTKKARAAVDIRLVNVMTGEIIAAEKAEGEESSTGISVSYSDIDFSNTNSWDDTDIGKATRKAVDGCTSVITENMDKVPWSGKIIRVNPDGTLLMKPGSEGNVEVGMEFVVYRAGEDIIDPDTGLSMGSEETKVGRIKVKEDMLKGKACKAEAVEGSGFQAGDIVRDK